MRFCGYSNKTSVSTLYCLILDRPFPINVTGVAHDKYSQFSISGDGGGVERTLLPSLHGLDKYVLPDRVPETCEFLKVLNL